MKADHIPPVIVACVGLLVTGFVWSQSWLGIVAPGCFAMLTCVLAWIVKAKSERVFDGRRLASVVSFLGDKLPPGHVEIVKELLSK